MRTGFLRMLGALMLAVMSVTGAAAQSTEIEGTINSQFEAFKADDFATAFTYATPSLQQLFQSPQNFQRMVTQGYPMVWRPAEVRYLELRERGGSMWQKVQITDAKGFTHNLDYKMEETDMGWRIGAVQILDAPGATA
ncbi:DUF4864 domain-containing protein [Sulfitobacter sp. PR48]|uniref:DUF4864 domain-containing protein n=1 Tax=Sulfitobacter sp. PR48 TaxID=3028383 RepID=UPI00237B4C96|nr:DUF4864 domain-containing protein [Sulfitobacter sp. PR48]MDD9720322.1 DUF4864 domain-containing protein [Sulfitobacter sp. PR48]